MLYYIDENALQPRAVVQDLVALLILARIFYGQLDVLELQLLAEYLARKLDHLLHRECLDIKLQLALERILRKVQDISNHVLQQQRTHLDVIRYLTHRAGRVGCLEALIVQLQRVQWCFEVMTDALNDLYFEIFQFSHILIGVLECYIIEHDHERVAIVPCEIDEFDVVEESGICLLVVGNNHAIAQKLVKFIISLI